MLGRPADLQQKEVTTAAALAWPTPYSFLVPPVGPVVSFKPSSKLKVGMLHFKLLRRPLAARTCCVGLTRAARGLSDGGSRTAAAGATLDPRIVYDFEDGGGRIRLLSGCASVHACYWVRRCAAACEVMLHVDCKSSFFGGPYTLLSLPCST